MSEADCSNDGGIADGNCAAGIFNIKFNYLFTLKCWKNKLKIREIVMQDLVSVACLFSVNVEEQFRKTALTSK